jgi:hypothetical protein
LIKHVYAVDRAYIWLIFFLKKKKKKNKIRIINKHFLFLLRPRRSIFYSIYLLV